MAESPSFQIGTTFSEPTNSNIRSIGFNSDGGYCITASSDKTVKLWNPYKSLLLKTYQGHGQDVLDVHSSKDNSMLVSGSKDQVVFLWDVLTGHSIRRYRGHHSSVNCVRFNYNDCSVIVSGGADNSVICWDVRSKGYKPIQCMKDATDAILSLSISEFEILTGSVDGKIRIYDMRRGIVTSDHIGKPITNCYFSLDGMSYICCAIGGPIRMMDKSTGSCLNRYSGHKNDSYKVETCISSDAHLISGSEDGKLYIWNLIDANLIKIIKTGFDYVLTIAHHPKSKILLTASGSKACMWAEEEKTEE